MQSLSKFVRCKSVFHKVLTEVCRSSIRLKEMVIRSIVTSLVVQRRSMLSPSCKTIWCWWDQVQNWQLLIYNRSGLVKSWLAFMPP